MALFDDFARSLGLTAYWPKSDELFYAIAQGMQTRARRMQEINFVVRRPPIEVELLNSEEFNAVAGIEQDTDVIGVNIGLLFICRRLFGAILAHPELLKHVGNPSIEIAPPQFDAEQESIDIDGLAAFGTSFRPKDPVRANYAASLCSLAEYFVLQHEFCHIFNGHIDWLNKTTGLKALSEINASKIDNLTYLNLQTLEMDADCAGAYFTLLDVFRVGPEKVFRNPSIATYKDALFAIEFALYCLFRIFHNQPISEDVVLLGGDDHPPAILRSHIVGAVISSRILDNKTVSDFISLGDSAEISQKSFFEAETAFWLLTGNPKSHVKDRFPENIIKKSKEAGRELAENWKKLRLELLPFKRGRALSE